MLFCYSRPSQCQLLGPYASWIWFALYLVDRQQITSPPHGMGFERWRLSSRLSHSTKTPLSPIMKPRRLSRTRHMLPPSRSPRIGSMHLMPPLVPLYTKRRSMRPGHRLLIESCKSQLLSLLSRHLAHFYIQANPDSLSHVLVVSGAIC